jgi:selenide,water dikinase
LAHVLQPLRETFDENAYPNLLVGLGRADDAAVYQLNDQQAIISTTDFFPPVVDDPYDFGAIAAANALSDIYAMGGRVLFALNLVAFPDDLDKSILRDILRGGAEKVAEAGGVIAGGHTVTDPEPKYGLAVTGIIDPQRVLRKGGARDGDVLLLTKPLGVGVITTALKRDLTQASEVAAAVASMKTLNRQASEAAIAANASSMTDITGFGLLGHAHEMAAQGAVDFHFEAAQLPWLDGTRKYGQQRVFPGGTRRNREHFGKFVTFSDQIDAATRNMLWTPETSGGLLIAVSPTDVATVQANCSSAVIVGRVTNGTGRIAVV